ncbi:hypothetical protein HOF65_03760 [bacterium]|nr:hypothetical protein [bacterium]MBT3853092.1 hypothetical protein [bacterium]MBT4633551.1 hypothetical protein [bacterium]MBT6778597.1 hypothetical protein [bacterium]
MIDGVYHTVHKSFGNIVSSSSSISFLYCLLEVQVFAAICLPGIAKK